MRSTRPLSALIAVGISFLLTAVVLARGLTSADLSITKTDGAASSVPGEMVTYTIVASNSGPNDVMGATVTDTFPAALTCTWTCIASGGSSCTAAGSGDINDAVNLLDGGTATYTAVCSIDPSATGMLSNTATVSSALSDPNGADNSAVDANTLSPQADVSIAASVTPIPQVPNGPFTITVTVDNAGPSDAQSVVVSSVEPIGFTFDSTTGCAEDPAGVVSCTLGTVPAGGSVSFDIQGTAPPGATASGTGTFDVSTTTPDSDPSDDATTVALGFDISVIPTLGTWGLMAMVLLLLGVALRRIA